MLLGYFAEVAEDLDRHPKSNRHDDFTFDRFTKYLGRGVYAFLAQLLVALIGFVFMAVAAGVGVAVWQVSEQPAAGIAVGVVSAIVTGVAVSLVNWPVTLHAQLSGGLDFADTLDFTRDFLRRVGWDTFGTLLAFVPIALGVSLLGMMACFVGIYPASVVLLAAQEHLMVQLYHRYLDAGGEPIGWARSGGLTRRPPLHGGGRAG